jgi:hypothetical protein
VELHKGLLGAIRTGFAVAFAERDGQLGGQLLFLTSFARCNPSQIV